MKLPLRRLYHWFIDLFNYKPKNQVLKIIHGIAALELTPMENVIMKAPQEFEVYSDFKISGNSMPLIEYKVFDETNQDFVNVSVVLQIPDKIRPSAKLLKTDADGLNPVPTEIELNDEWLHPFYFWMGAVSYYWPLVKESRIPKVSTYV